MLSCLLGENYENCFSYPQHFFVDNPPDYPPNF